VVAVVPPATSRTPQPPKHATSAFNTLPHAAATILHPSQGWIPSINDMFYAIPVSEHRLKESGSGLGLTGVYTEPASTITKGVTHDLPFHGPQDFTPTLPTSMPAQYIATSPASFSLGQRMFWDDLKHADAGCVFFSFDNE
jgi:hypothetical protein